MKFDRVIFPAAVLLLVSFTAFTAEAADKKNSAKSEGKTVDSGSFGIFVKGARVATETFHIRQNADSSIKSEFKQTAGSDPVTQKSDLELTSNGELVRYDWSQSSGGSLAVLPNNEFLIEKMTAPGSSKPAEQPFLMPNTSPILDNNFFIHREVLIWRYLAADCKPEGQSMKCQKEPGEFGVVIPQDRSSARIRVELVGDEKVNVRGTDRNLLRLNLKGDSFEWSLWVDAGDQFKLIKVAIPADNTEVVRD
ncbi:MAG TPA: hypothetical protein VGS27_18595 [Candidatus Sulfotelmatobacter sp.]|nr:hypothetical protein [Candidatus Sulfotelmatobacter sp.]